MQSDVLNPFPGLRSFQTNEEYLFFGREGQSEEILGRLRANRFLAVIGTSGSGKSSLIQAGLLPYLYGGFMAGAGSHWRVATLRPGNDPIGNLAAALNDPGVIGAQGEPEEEFPRSRMFLEVTLRRSGLGLIEAVRLARLPDREHVLIIVDQFEELFRFADALSTMRQQDDAAAFIKLLLEATAQEKLPIYVVLTMRSEFIGDCAKFHGLPEAVTAGPYLIPWMTREQRRSAIEEPARVAQQTISPRLVNRLLNDGGENPDQLPILQHCLMRTWDYWREHSRDHDPVDLEHYEKIGGIEKALSRHADAAYEELPNDRLKSIAKKLFQSLTEKGSDNREIRRPTTVGKIAAAANADVQEVISVAERFRAPACAFLMPPEKVPLDENKVLDISHESLIRGWDRLKGWVEEEAESAKIYRRLAEWAERWSNNRAAFWVDPDLQSALDWVNREQPNEAWAERYHHGFKLAIQFLDESRKDAHARREAEEKEKLEDDQRKAEELRRTRSHLKLVRLLCVLLTAALFWIVLSGFKNRSLRAQMNGMAKLAAGVQLQSALQFLKGIHDLSYQETREQALKNAKNVSEQVLQLDGKNSDAKLLLAASLSGLSELHANFAADDKDKQAALQECHNNIQAAEGFAKGADPSHDPLAAGMLLASSAQILQNLGDTAGSRDTALRATQLLESAALSVPLSDDADWMVVETSYSGADSVLKGESRTESIPSKVLTWIKPDKNINGESADPSSHRATMLFAIADVAAQEEDSNNKPQAFETYLRGTQLADRFANVPDPSPEVLDAAFWLFSDVGTAYANGSSDKEKAASEKAQSWDKAKTAFDKAQSFQQHMPAGSEYGQRDKIAALYFSGEEQWQRAKAETGDVQRQALDEALQYYDEGISLDKEWERQHPDDIQLGTLLALGAAEDSAGLKPERTEQYLRGRLAEVEREPRLKESERALQLGYLCQGALVIYDHVRNFAVARTWADRGIKVLTPGTGLNADTKGIPANQNSVAAREMLSGLFGGRSWIDLFLGDFKGAITDATVGFRLDPTQYWILTNEGHGFLLSGNYRRAEQIYLDNADRPTHGKTFRAVVLDDFQEFIEHPNSQMKLDDIRKMKAELLSQEHETSNAEVQRGSR